MDGWLATQIKYDGQRDLLLSARLAFVSPECNIQSRFLNARPFALYSTLTVTSDLEPVFVEFPALLQLVDFRGEHAAWPHDNGLKRHNTTEAGFPANASFVNAPT